MSTPDARAPMPGRLAHLTGGCQCGAVRFAFYAAPLRIGVCHCRMCQKAAGAPFMALADIAYADFAWTRGLPASYQSSSRALRDFCQQCGTPLAYRQIGGANIELMCGAFDTPDAVAPTYAVGVESKVAWVDRLAALPAKTTDVSMGAAVAASITCCQHPDHDTPGGWSPVRS